jgi:hypothetical protein
MPKPLFSLKIKKFNLKDNALQIVFLSFSVAWYHPSVHGDSFNHYFLRYFVWWISNRFSRWKDKTLDESRRVEDLQKSSFVIN